MCHGLQPRHARCGDGHDLSVAAVDADTAYDDTKRRQRWKDRGIKPRILVEARRNKPLRTWQKDVNMAATVVRAAAGRTFALMQGPDDFARCRCRGLERNGTHLQRFASAYDLKTALLPVRRGGIEGASCAR